MYPSGSVPALIYGTPKMNKFSSRIHFVNLVTSFNLYVPLIIIFRFPLWLCFMITLAKILFLLFLKFRMQIFPKKLLVSYDVTSLFTNIPLQETINIAKNLIFNHKPNLNITKKELKKTFPFRNITDSFYF